MCTATAKEVVQDAVVIIDTLLIYSAFDNALFDFGSTHTFIARTFVDRIGVTVKDLGYNLVVSTLARAVLTTEVFVRGVYVVIQ